MRWDKCYSQRTCEYGFFSTFLQVIWATLVMVSVLYSFSSLSVLSYAEGVKDARPILTVFSTATPDDNCSMAQVPLTTTPEVREGSCRQHRPLWRRMNKLAEKVVTPPHSYSAEPGGRNNRGAHHHRSLRTPASPVEEHPLIPSSRDFTRSRKCADQFFASTCLTFSSVCRWCCDAPVGRQCFNVSETIGRQSGEDGGDRQMTLHTPVQRAETSHSLHANGTNFLSREGWTRKLSLLDDFSSAGQLHSEDVSEGCRSDATISSRRDSCAARCASFGRNCSACEAHSWCVYCLDYNAEESRETFSSLSSIQGVCQTPRESCKRGRITQQCSSVVEKVPPLFFVRANDIMNAIGLVGVELVVAVGTVVAFWLIIKRMRSKLPLWVSRAKQWEKRLRESFFCRWIRQYFRGPDGTSNSEVNDIIVENREGEEPAIVDQHRTTGTEDLQQTTEIVEDSNAGEEGRNLLGICGGERTHDRGRMQRNMHPSSLFLSALLSPDFYFDSRGTRHHRRAAENQVLRSSHTLPLDSTPEHVGATPPSSSVGFSSIPALPQHHESCPDGGEKGLLPCSPQTKEEHDRALPPSILNCFELCCLCLETPAAVTYLPCHHTCCCELCSNRLRPSASSPSADRSIVCPLCRTRIEAMVSLPQIFGVTNTRR